MIKVAVIGCGVIGLTTALEIQKRLGSRGHVTIFSDEFSPNTTADLAAGLWEPYLVQETPLEYICRWAKDTQDFILNLWKQGYAKEAGVCLVPVYNLSENENFKLPEWTKITFGFSELSERQLDTFSKLYNAQFTGGFCFTSFIWEAKFFLPFLTRRFLKIGGAIVKKHIENFECLIGFDVIVNCTGLNARHLVEDPHLKPIRGQIVRVKSPWVFHTFILDASKSCYIIPNTHCTILGGTNQESYDTKVDETDKKNILENCRKLMPSLCNAEIVKHQVGLRPGRIKVRVEEEIRNDGGSILKIVHNYGHGGAGITLSIGCAKDAADLVEKLLKVDAKSKL